MAIVIEQFYVGNRLFNRVYSDDNRYVIGGEPYGEYTEACDPAEYGRIYAEGYPIYDSELDAGEALAILLGGHDDEL